MVPQPLTSAIDSLPDPGAPCQGSTFSFNTVAYWRYQDLKRFVVAKASNWLQSRLERDIFQPSLSARWSLFGSSLDLFPRRRLYEKVHPMFMKPQGEENDE